MKKIVISAALLILCGIGIVSGGKYLISQEPVNIETVSDNLEETGKPSSEQRKSGLDINAKAAVLIDGETGKVLYEKDAHKELPPASVTKIMTMLLTLEAADSGKAKLSDTVTISERAASMGGSQMYMEIGEEHTLEELLEGIAIVSANDACVAAAEYIAGSEEIFVEQMNKRARDLKMNDTHFANTNGLPVAEHYTSAYDIGVMSRLLLQHKETSKWFSTWQTTIKVGLPGKEKDFGLTNTNRLIKQYKGANGIKTGFTQEAGYCLSASATREGTTLIAVVLGCETSKIRFEEVSKLFNYGFATYSSVTVAEKGQKMKRVQLLKGEPYSVDAAAKEKITALVKKGEESKISSKINIDKNIKLPLKKGNAIGSVIVYDGKEKVGKYILVADRSVEKASFITYYIRKIKRVFR